MAPSLPQAARHYDDGIAALEAGRHAEAIGALEQALAANPGDPAILYALGEAATQLGLHQAAVRFFPEPRQSASRPRSASPARCSR
jgi:tetratricopeptide (TPR) repeat protein